VKVALDTNRLTDLFRGDAALAGVAGELRGSMGSAVRARGRSRAGFYGGTQQNRNAILLKEFLSRTTVGGFCIPTRETAGAVRAIICPTQARWYAGSR